MPKRHLESHRTERVSWLRAAVLGANDGIVSTASLIVGVAASHASSTSILVAGVAGLFGGAFSMAAGEYVSVSSQADTEKADLDVERRELETSPQQELKELAGIYVKRGLDPALAAQVAEQLTAHDALGAHARDELGITRELRARPVQAALSSAAAFTCGATLPLLCAYLLPDAHRVPGIILAALVFLAILGALAARAGGAGMLVGATRVVAWSAAAMLATAWIGSLFEAGAAAV